MQSDTPHHFKSQFWLYSPRAILWLALFLISIWNGFLAIERTGRVADSVFTCIVGDMRINQFDELICPASVQPGETNNIVAKIATRSGLPLDLSVNGSVFRIGDFSKPVGDVSCSSAVDAGSVTFTCPLKVQDGLSSVYVQFWSGPIEDQQSTVVQNHNPWGHFYYCGGCAIAIGHSTTPILRFIVGPLFWLVALAAFVRQLTIKQMQTRSIDYVMLGALGLCALNSILFLLFPPTRQVPSMFSYDAAIVLVPLVILIVWAVRVADYLIKARRDGGAVPRIDDPGAGS